MRQHLFGDQAVKDWPIIVETRNQVVYLAGKINSHGKRAHIIKLAKRVKGVKSVKSVIKVE